MYMVGERSASGNGLIQTKNLYLEAYVNGDDGGKLGLVLPGRGEKHIEQHMQRLVDLYAKLGFLGVSFSWPAAEQFGTYGQTTPRQHLAAVHEVLRHFSFPDTLASGHSMGGRYAILAAERNVCINSLAVVMTAFRLKDISIPLSAEEQEALTTLETFDIVNILKKSKDPKLFIAGKRDEVVKASSVKKLFEASRGPKQFEVIESEHYYQNDPAALDRVDSIVEAFITNNNLLAR